MSQVNVERVIGMLATDEGLRRRFNKDQRAVLLELVERGLELTVSELWSLSHMDPRELARFADAIGPRLQKTELRRGVL